MPLILKLKKKKKSSSQGFHIYLLRFKSSALMSVGCSACKLNILGDQMTLEAQAF